MEKRSCNPLRKDLAEWSSNLSFEDLKQLGSAMKVVDKSAKTHQQFPHNKEQKQFLLRLVQSQENLSVLF